MKDYLKFLFGSLNEIPEGKFSPDVLNTPGFVRSIIFGNYAYPSGLFAHVMFLIIFALIGVKALVLFNIFSVILWVTAVVLHRHGHVWPAYILITVEIIAHAAVCIVVIGWGAGFQYYVLIQPAVVFLLPGSTLRKAGIVAIYTCAFAAMSYYGNAVAPQIELFPIYISAFNYGNIFSSCALLAYLAFQYCNAAINAEKRLEKQYQKTNEALKERNLALERLHLELSEAADYVKTILPPPITEGSIRTDWRFVPSTSLGGDAFGYHMLDEDHFAIYLIDVSGHGVGAALLSVSVMNVLRSQSLPDTDFKNPEQVLLALNIAFPGEEHNDMFFTIWYGVYDKNNRVLSFASGGHPPALLLENTSTDESHAAQLRTPNSVIGGLPGGKYQKREHQIGIQSKLYVFSDGVYEVEKKDGSMWDFHEFADFMNNSKTEGQSILDRLYSYATKLGDTDNLQDDFTIVEVTFQ